MKRIFNVGCFALSALYLSGCAHLHQAAESPKTGAQEVRIEISNTEVGPGDLLRVYTRECSGLRISRRADLDRVCNDVNLGEAEVIESVDSKVALVRLAGDLVFSENMRFEKLDN